MSAASLRHDIEMLLGLSGAQAANFWRIAAPSPPSGPVPIPYLNIAAGTPRPAQSAGDRYNGQYLVAVSSGHVRVVRETERKWNYREQKYDTQEAESYEGNTDERGHFVAHVDLAAEHSRLGEDTRRERFSDLTFAAYFTDSTTGRTEERRFDVRVTLDSIHIYVIQATPAINEAAARAGRFPVDLYLSTSYADGSPAQCDVEIDLIDLQALSEAGGQTPVPELPLRHVQTNRYGVAKVTGLSVPIDRRQRELPLRFHARDNKSGTGTRTEPLWHNDGPVISVDTDRAIYRPGQPIQVVLRTSQARTTVIVDVVKESVVLDSRIVAVRQGRARLDFDTDERFQNGVTILAYPMPASRYPDFTSHTIWFPKDRGLNVDVRFDKSTYRPGEAANADFRVRGPDGQTKNVALGLAVVDRAVEERQRTEQDFQRNRGLYDFLSSWVWRGEENDEVAGIRLSDLDKLDPRKPVTEAFDLVAEILLQRHEVSPGTFRSEFRKNDIGYLFTGLMRPRAYALGAVLEAHYRQTQEYPRTVADLDTIAGMSVTAWRDPWGRPYHFVFAPDHSWDAFTIVSDGPDKNFDSDDDIEVFHLYWPYFKRYEGPMQRAVDGYHTRTGGFIRDPETFKAELARQGVVFDQLRDPWGHAYRLAFPIQASRFLVTVESPGPDGRFSTGLSRLGDGDDVNVASVGIDYFAETRSRIDLALVDSYRTSQSFPVVFEAFSRTLTSARIDWQALRDPWSRPYYFQQPIALRR